jgi:hypothetical protein
MPALAAVHRAEQGALGKSLAPAQVRAACAAALLERAESRELCEILRVVQDKSSLPAARFESFLTWAIVRKFQHVRGVPLPRSSRPRDTLFRWCAFLAQLGLIPHGHVGIWAKAAAVAVEKRGNREEHNRWRRWNEARSEPGGKYRDFYVLDRYVLKAAQDSLCALGIFNSALTLRVSTVERQQVGYLVRYSRGKERLRPQLDLNRRWLMRVQKPGLAIVEGRFVIDVVAQVADGLKAAVLSWVNGEFGFTVEIIQQTGDGPPRFKSKEGARG